MPIELPTVVITGRRSDFSSVNDLPATDPMDPEAHDTLEWLIRATKNVDVWMSERRNEVNRQYEQNMASLDAELDSEIKEVGGLSVAMDLSTPIGAVVKEKNIIVRLSLAKESTAQEKTLSAARLFAGNVLNPSSANGSDFALAQGYQVKVDTLRLANWANSLQEAKLAQVYNEMQQRLKRRADSLESLENALRSRAAEELGATMEQIRLKQYPMAPSGVSLTQNLQISREQKEYFKNGGGAFLFSWFYTKVRNRGDWDYKQHGREFANFGNFNYGAVGTASGISEQVLLRAAGAAQTVAGTSQADFDTWWAEAPYGDDPIDQAWIKAGIDYAKSQGY